MPVENGSGGLVGTLVGLSIDAPMLVQRDETATQWAELGDAAEEVQGVAEAVLVRTVGDLGRGSCSVASWSE